MLIQRPYWLKKIESSWKKRNLIWLSGPRRIGKTTLIKSISGSTYLNCDLPSVCEMLDNPEYFFSQVKTQIVVFDEIHKLANPSLVLKIGTDEYPHLKMIATGSSTLAATEKFKDSLTGRKRNLMFLPILLSEMADFEKQDLEHRLLKGGFPQPFLDNDWDDEFYAEWFDSYFARDIQELFKVEKRVEFINLLKLFFRQSGGLVEYTSLGKHVGLSRPTVTNYSNIFSTTEVLRFVYPYSQGGRREIIAQPKAYGMDTGFVSWSRGWRNLNDSNQGFLWEHLVLESLLATLSSSYIFYWRDKSQREIDFVIHKGGMKVHAIECKWNLKHFESKSVKIFRSLYSEGKNFLVVPGYFQPYEKKIDDHLTILVCHPFSEEFQQAIHE